MCDFYPKVWILSFMVVRIEGFGKAILGKLEILARRKWLPQHIKFVSSEYNKVTSLETR